MTELCRRSVLKGAAATCGVAVLAGCGDGGGGEVAAPTATGSAGAGLRVPLADLADIPVGGAVSAKAPDGTKVLISRPSEAEAVAFSAICPHQGCTVEPDGEQFTCPCHGSQYELDGSLKRGPATRGLSSYDVRVFDGKVLPA